MANETNIIHKTTSSRVNLREYLAKAENPLLCLGPMSKNCVDAIIKFANKNRRPLPLIASRRQIECSEFGGGYVNSWDTSSFAQYVRENDQGGFVSLCRDHGGPWQGSAEADLSKKQAMQRAKVSLAQDIANGFDLLHLDPSIKGGSIVDPESLEMIYELYEFVCETAQKLGRTIEIEVGAEQQSGHFSDAMELVAFLKAITSFCNRTNLQRPLFCVVQTGTLVKEMRNVGFTEGRRNESYDQKYAVESIERTISQLADIAYINGVYIKEHNGDYLSDGSMALRAQLKVGAINIAPELGVLESKCLISLCHECGNSNLAERFLQLFYNSKKWDKWLSQESRATDLERAIMAGHYTFAKPEFKELYDELALELKTRSIDLDSYLVTQLMALITRFSWNLGHFAQYNLFNNNLQEQDENGSDYRPVLSGLCQQAAINT